MAAIYGEFKYGTEKYAAVSSNLQWILLVDWDNDGVYEGLESDRLMEVSTERGRDRLFSSSEEGEAQLGRMQAGQCRLTLDNYDRRYTPWYTSSPIYPNVLPSRGVILKVRDGTTGNLYNVFTGKIEDIPSARLTEQTISIVVSDGWRMLARQRSTVALLTDATADELIDDILTDVSWPAAWGSSLDAGSDTIPYAWVDSQGAFDALHDLAESEMGLVYVGANGKFYFKSRHTLMLAASALTLDQSQVEREIDVGNPLESVLNKISIRAFPRQLGSLGEIWRLDEVPLVAPGQSRTIWATFRDSNYNSTIAQDVVSPAATTDYVMNTESGGGGTDLTASFSVTATIFAGSAKLVITNNASVDGYITLLKIRGKPLELLNTSASISESASSQALYGKRQLTLELPFQQHVDVGADMSDWLLSWLTAPSVPIIVAITGRPDIQFAHELGTYLTFTSSYLGIDRRFRIGKIRHESSGSMQMIRSLWTLEPADQQVDYWQLGVAGNSELGTHTRLAF